MKKIFLILFIMLSLIAMSCNNTEPYTGLSELTINLSTPNIADVVNGEVFLQNNSDSSQIHNGFISFNKVSFSEIEIGEYSLIMETKKIVDNIRVSKRTHTFFIQLDETKVGAIMDKAKQTYLETFLTEGNTGATLDDISFMPFMGIFDDSLVAVFYEREPRWDYSYDLSENVIGNLTFYWHYRYPILVWNENNIYELSESYEQGLLSNENLLSIYNSNLKYSEMIQRIKHDYSDFAPSIMRNEPEIDYVIIHYYYGTFNDSIVMALSSMMYIYMQVVGDAETVAGRFFGYPYIGYEILVWHEGIFYKLRHAYTANLLTDDNIEIIWYQFQKDRGWN